MEDSDPDTHYRGVTDDGTEGMLFPRSDPIGQALSQMRRHGHKDLWKGFVDYTDLKSQPTHKDAPLWVCPNGDIYLEAYSPFYQQAKEFLQQCAEPQ